MTLGPPRGIMQLFRPMRAGRNGDRIPLPLTAARTAARSARVTPSAATVRACPRITCAREAEQPAPSTAAAPSNAHAAVAPIASNVRRRTPPRHITGLGHARASSLNTGAARRLFVGWRKRDRDGQLPAVLVSDVCMPTRIAGAVVTAQALRQNERCVSGRLALLAASAAAPLLFGAAESSLPARRADRCQPAQVKFAVERQPINSVTTGFSVTAKTRRAGFSCTVQGYPSVTVPGGAHGPVHHREQAALGWHRHT